MFNLIIIQAKTMAAKAKSRNERNTTDPPTAKGCDLVDAINRIAMLPSPITSVTSVTF